MNENLFSLISRYKRNGILIDTNLLLLFVVGWFNPLFISKISRTAGFSYTDFQLVSKTVDYFDIRVTTPSTLTEASNLPGRGEEVRTALRTYIRTTEERSIIHVKIAENELFLAPGLTDAGIIETAKGSF